jgi:hypothetical protein
MDQIEKVPAEGIQIAADHQIDNNVPQDLQ